jgi:hypothetical protein
MCLHRTSTFTSAINLRCRGLGSREVAIRPDAASRA